MRVAAITLLLMVVAAEAATVESGSCSFVDVSNAVYSAAANDVVRVPAGTATWEAQLRIAKGITLQGAGSGQTVIAASLGASAFCWWYQPADASLDQPFRVTGFTFDLMTNTLGFMVYNPDSQHVQHSVRIDHNVWTNCPLSGPNFVTFNIDGAVCGVFDHNRIYGSAFWHNDGNGADDWNYRTFDFGTTNNFYLEDNYFQNAYGICGAGNGGRYAARYNTFDLTATSLHPLFDGHGNQGTGIFSGMVAEIYGNKINAPLVGANGVDVFHHRGGRALLFYNQIVEDVGSAYMQVQEEYDDGLNATSNSTPQHVSGSYYWNNREAGTNGALISVELLNPPYGGYASTNLLAANVDFWTNVAAFDGTVGVGTGPLAARPATCLPGVGYWATTQDTAAIPASCVGTNPATPISGTLYRATATNTWEAFYTPLTYPHPLVTAQDGTEPKPTPDETPAISAGSATSTSVHVGILRRSN